jgi:hypothetical protein
MKPKIINTNYPVIKHAESIESILCLTALIASDKLSYNATLEDSFQYFDGLGLHGCYNCELKDKCLACIINQ